MNRINFVELAKDGMEVHSSMPDCPEYLICQELLRLTAENEALKALFRRNQEPLSEEFEKVLKDNLWQLYEDSNK